MPDAINRVIGWSMTARKDGLLGLESVAEAEMDLYAQKGLQLLVDGMESEGIRSILEVDLYTQEDRDLQAAKFYECMGWLCAHYWYYWCCDGVDSCDG